MTIMNIFRLGLVSILSMTYLCVWARADDEASSKLAIENIVIIDVLADSEQEARLANQTVLIEGDRITQVGPNAKVTIPEDANRIDGTGKFLVPGFWDMHAHVHWPGDDVEKIVLPLMFAHGITGLRDMSSDNGPPRKTLHDIRKMRLAIASGDLRGPRLMALSIRINGARNADISARMTVAPQTELQGKMAAQLASYRGVDFIKVYSDLPRKAFFGLMEEANKLGLPVAGHLPQSVTPIEASNAGMCSIEHARFPALACGPGYEPWRAAVAVYTEDGSETHSDVLLRKHQATLIAEFDQQLCEEICETFAKNGTHLCPTHTTRKMDAFASDPEYRADTRRKYISPLRLRNDWDLDLQATASVPPYLVTHFKEFFQLGLRVTGIAHRKGVRILAGTDSYDTHVFPGFSYHDELQHLREAGLSPLDVLKAATIRPAEFLKQSNSFGSVAINKVADLVILDSDPLVDISNTRRIDSVIFGGRSYDRRELQATIQGVEDYVADLVEQHETQLTLQASLYDGVIGGDVLNVLAAIKDGADVNGLDTRQQVAGGNGRRPLNYAASRNDTDMIVTLLDAGAGIDLTNRSGFTALHHAAEAGATDAAKLLITKGASLTSKNRRGQTAEDVAESSGRDQTAVAIRKAMTKRP